MAVSPWMSFIDEVNGVSINGTVTIVTRCNGLMMTLYWNSVFELHGVQLGAVNKAKKVKGLQIGLINSTKNLKGFQVGLWNINSKRQLPVINWNWK